MVRFLMLLILIGAPVWCMAEDDVVRPTVSISIATSNADAERARVGDTITVTVLASEPVTVPRVLIAGNDVATSPVGFDSLTYTASITVSDMDVEGVASVEVTDFEDMAHNPGVDVFATTDGSLVMIDRTEPEALEADLTQEAQNAAGATFMLPTVSDALDGELIPSCTYPSGTPFALGTHAITCSVLDRAGNESEGTFSLFVVDTTPPVITLNGNTTVTLSLNQTFTDPGATAYDVVDLIVPVLVSGAVTTAVDGTYTITYTATDTIGNTSALTRTVVVEPTSTGGGGGGGGGSRSRASTTDTASDEEEPEVVAEVPEDSPLSGEVLGAATYNFTRFLKRGDTGADVTELQRLLLAAGYFSGETTAYFGPQTEAALRTYQSAHGLEAVGFIGPKTLALLNSGSVPGTPTLAELLAKLATLQAELNRLKGL